MGRVCLRWETLREELRISMRHYDIYEIMAWRLELQKSKVAHFSLKCCSWPQRSAEIRAQSGYKFKQTRANSSDKQIHQNRRSHQTSSFAIGSVSTQPLASGRVLVSDSRLRTSTNIVRKP